MSSASMTAVAWSVLYAFCKVPQGVLGRRTPGLPNTRVRGRATSGKLIYCATNLLWASAGGKGPGWKGGSPRMATVRAPPTARDAATYI